MATTTATNNFTMRIVGACSLDAAIYEEVEADRSATGQACAVVLLSSVAAGLGSRDLTGASSGGVLFMAMLALVAWATWALVVYEIGSRLLPEPQTRVDVGELLRTMGFASAPGLFRILGLMSHATIPIFAVTAVWMLAATVIAVRQALDFHGTGRAIAVCALGWALAIGIVLAIGLFFGPTVS